MKKAVNPRSRAFEAADSNFENCPCGIKIRFVPGGHISLIEVSLTGSGEIHSHPELHPRTKKISADIVKMDPTLVCITD